MAISSIPSGRVSDQLIRARLMSQLQFDQRELFRVQTQVSTGFRIALPSEDAPAALRAISLQRLLERKAQVSVNLQTSQSYLSATDSALNNVSSVLADIRGAALGVSDSTNTATQRQAVVTSIERAIDQLVNTGNQTFRGRYLFAGSRTTTQPFQRGADYVSYNGNEDELQSYSDLDVLFASSVNGHAVFGSLSEPVGDGADLNPVLTENTLISDLRGGRGISVGSIAVSDGASTRVIDVSSAKTVGDLVRLIESNPPASRTLRVSIKPTGIDIVLSGGALRITEVAGGTTASELGILHQSQTPTTSVSGQDLNPILRTTTPLDRLLGTRAAASIQMPGANNDLYLEASRNGADLNGVTVQFVDDALLHAAPPLALGAEVAVYSETAQAARAALRLNGGDNDLVLQAKTAGADFNNVKIVLVDAGDVKDNPTATYTDVAGIRTLTLGIDDSGETSLQALVDAINADTPFTASPDASNGEAFDGAGFIDINNVGSVAGNTGASGGAANTLYVHINSEQTTAREVVQAINAEGTFTARIDAHDAVTSTQAGSGLITTTVTATTAGGSGAVFDKSSGIRVVNGGETYEFSFAAAETVEDLLNIINGSAAGLLAEINADGSGIDVRSRLSGVDFAIGENGGETATQLGIRSLTGNTKLSSLNHGIGVQIVDGVDFTIVANDGVRLDIDLSGAKTIDDVLAKINNHPDNAGGARVTAQLAEFGNGIELVDDNPSGFDSTGQPRTVSVERSVLSLAAVHLGLVPEGADRSPPPVAAVAPTAKVDLTNANTDLSFTAQQAGTQFGDVKIVFVNNSAVGDQALVHYDANAKTLTIDVDPAATRAVTVAAAVTNEGTFRAVLDTSAGPNSGQGLVVDVGQVATTSAGAPEKLTGADPHPVKTSGVFNSLYRLSDALKSGDEAAIQRAVALLDADIERVNFSRAEIGGRQQALDVLQTRLGAENVELRDALSVEIEADYAEVITEMTARQFAMQASLRTTASMLQYTLLDFL